ncbi:hypothetical protein [Tardiphaga sp.]|uniref:hypothetical protein n=1 Tax=Tardiphaga sp. TaxID=1926292 RepID=UPI002614E189|nr:hypothetical protein [Tardiphaga sp.]MDB5618029.1 hypothetical protein [Tardiphaga sp.]
MPKRKFLTIATAVGAVGLIAGGSVWLLWPEADNWTEEARACVTDKYVGYWESSGTYAFKLDYENNCDRKISCAVNVSINNARETVRDRGILVFAARGQTPAANSYSVSVTSLIGMAQAERSCRFV